MEYPQLWRGRTETTFVISAGNAVYVLHGGRASSNYGGKTYGFAFMNFGHYIQFAIEYVNYRKKEK